MGGGCNTLYPVLKGVVEVARRRSYTRVFRRGRSHHDWTWLVTRPIPVLHKHRGGSRSDSRQTEPFGMGEKVQITLVEEVLRKEKTRQVFSSGRGG